MIYSNLRFLFIACTGMYFWLHVRLQGGLKQLLHGRDAVRLDEGGLMRGSMGFQKRFLAIWKADENCDYITLGVRPSNGMASNKIEVRSATRTEQHFARPHVGRLRPLVVVLVCRTRVVKVLRVILRSSFA